MGGDILRSEKGLALIIALLALLILTLIGISSISTTTFETSISGNERVGTDAFYAAEAGIQIGLNQLPDVKAIPVTPIVKDSYSSCRSGSLRDNGAKDLKSLGPYPKPGFDSSWGFKRYQVNATGSWSVDPSSFKPMKEIEIQVRLGPFRADTGY